MNRRNFLKLFAIAPLGGLMAFRGYSGSEAAAPAKVLRGTPEGKIYESLDQGKTWQLAANFGENRSVLNISTRQGIFYAEIGCGEHSFTLQSTDGRCWRTVDQHARV
ncbi:MAG: hypothetical protein GX495_13555 [Chloroflexi bacterium]|nr:hypothetical protein [Chloroflexota bacterium]